MKALIPAAGLGTRWYPLSRYFPKELLPVGNYPLIHCVLDEAYRASCREIIIVYREEKRIIKEYVEAEWQKKKDVVIHWLIQSEPKGVGAALLCALDHVNSEPVAILYPDILHPIDGGVAFLSKLYSKYPAPWTGLMRRQPGLQQVAFAGEMALLEIGKDLRANIYKVNYAHKNEKIVGYGAGRVILPCLDHWRERKFVKNTNGEIDDTILFDSLWSNGVYAAELPSPIIDCGSPLNYRYRSPG